MSAYWRSKFKEYHAEHPDVYDLFEMFTLDRISKGLKCGASDVIGRVRWETNAGDLFKKNEAYKVNQNYARYYAEEFDKRNPQYAGFFSYRRTA